METDNSPTGDRQYRVTKWALIVGVLALVFPALEFYFDHVERPLASVFTGGPGGGGEDEEAPFSPPESSLMPAARVECRDSAAAPIGCGEAGAWGVPTLASPCSVEGVSTALFGEWGGTTRQLQLTVLEKGECVVAPAASVSVPEFVEFLGDPKRFSRISDRLGDCAIRSSRVDHVPCDIAHTLEFSSSWFSSSGSADRDTCRIRAVGYTGRNVSVGTGQLASVVARGDSGLVRCAVASDVPLRGSVWRIAGQELPIQARP